MSGGSFNYLYCKDGEDLLNSEEDLERMALSLEHRGYPDIALDTKSILNDVQFIKEKINELTERKNKLSEVWRAVEWTDSGDTTEKYIKKEAEKYREEGKNEKGR